MNDADMTTASPVSPLLSKILQYYPVTPPGTTSSPTTNSYFTLHTTSNPNPTPTRPPRKPPPYRLTPNQSIFSPSPTTSARRVLCTPGPGRAASPTFDVIPSLSSFSRPPSPSTTLSFSGSSLSSNSNSSQSFFESTPSSPATAPFPHLHNESYDHKPRAYNGLQQYHVPLDARQRLPSNLAPDPNLGPEQRRRLNTSRFLPKPAPVLPDYTKHLNNRPQRAPSKLITNLAGYQYPHREPKYKLPAPLPLPAPYQPESNALSLPKPYQPPPPSHPPSDSLLPLPQPFVPQAVPQAKEHQVNLQAPTLRTRKSVSPYRSGSASPKTKSDMDRQTPRQVGEDVHRSPNRITKSNRASPSPARPHHLNALSPLQSFSPLTSTQPLSLGQTQSQAASIPSRPSSVLSRSRASSNASLKDGASLSRSLSRRESLFASAARWTAGDVEEYAGQEADSEGYGGGVFSRLTLVRAPKVSTGLKRRSQSSSSLAPFSSLPDIHDKPATSQRGPRRSFAASSFGGMTPMVPIRAPTSFHIGGIDSSPKRQTDETINDTPHKILSPEEVFDLAKSLNSPIVASSGLPVPKSSELKRRKSAGSSYSRSARSSLGMSGLPEEEPKSPQAALEPVEYVQMDDDTLLPFIERPKEVQELVEHPSNEKLFALLKAAFPKEPLRDNWKKLPPTKWNWLEFIAHLTTIDRFDEPDYMWVRSTRDSVRERSVALWEKLGVCLGCNSDLLGDDDAEVGGSWGGLGGEEGAEGDGQVWVEGLMATTPTDIEHEKFGVQSGSTEAPPSDELMFAEFGDIVEGDEEAERRMRALTGMETIGEGEEESSGSGGNGLGEAKKTLQQAARMTPAQRAGYKPVIDPFNSPSHQFSNLRSSPTRSREQERDESGGMSGVGSVFASSVSSATDSEYRHTLSGSGLGLTSNNTSPKRLSQTRRLPSPNAASPDKIRSKSFVGLQILTSPVLPRPDAPVQLQHHHVNHFRHSPLSPIQPNDGFEYERERGPGSPLFPGRLDSLSLAPNLGRMASVALNPAMGQGVSAGAGGIVGSGGIGGIGGVEARGGRWGLPRKPSGAGLSESAITFGSESEYNPEGQEV